MVRDCVRRTGIRAYIYNLAHSNNGFHIDEDHIASLKYVETDLYVQVAFKVEDNAFNFQRKLNDFNSGFLLPGVKLCVVVSRTLSGVAGFDRIWPEDYSSSDSSSPTQSLLDVFQETQSEAATAVSFHSPLARYQSIEQPAAWATTRPERLHLISKCKCNSDSDYAKYKNSDDNLISASRYFHEFFDGINNDHEMIIMSMGEVGDAEMLLGGGSRVRVFVILTFLRDDVRDLVLPRLKVGTKLVNPKLNQYEVSLLVKNPTTFKFCLDWKMRSTINNLQRKRQEGMYIGADFVFTADEFQIGLSVEELSIFEDLENLMLSEDDNTFGGGIASAAITGDGVAKSEGKETAAATPPPPPSSEKSITFPLVLKPVSGGAGIPKRLGERGGER